MTLWGMTVIADSPQFSALAAASAPRERAGSTLAVMNAVGFALTIPAISLTAALWSLQATWVVWWLLPGPLLGLWVMRGVSTAPPETHEAPPSPRLRKTAPCAPPLPDHPDPVPRMSRQASPLLHRSLAGPHQAIARESGLHLLSTRRWLARGLRTDAEGFLGVKPLSGEPFSPTRFKMLLRGGTAEAIAHAALCSELLVPKEQA